MPNEEQIGFSTLKAKSKSYYSASPQTQGHPADLAAQIVGNYRNSTLKGETRVPVLLKTADNRPIDGFYFKFEDGLLEMLNRADVLGMYLAIGDLGNKGQTIMIYGVTNETRGEDGSGSNGNKLELLLEDNKIFDLCDPCPDRCPTNLKLPT